MVVDEDSRTDISAIVGEAAASLGEPCPPIQFLEKGAFGIPIARLNGVVKVSPQKLMNFSAGERRFLILLALVASRPPDMRKMKVKLFVIIWTLAAALAALQIKTHIVTPMFIAGIAVLALPIVVAILMIRMLAQVERFDQVVIATTRDPASAISCLEKLHAGRSLKLPGPLQRWEDRTMQKRIDRVKSQTAEQ